MRSCVARPFAQHDCALGLRKLAADTYNTELGIPVGLERLTHEHWVRHVKSDLPNSDFTWDQYVQHVQAGDGDDWFFEPRPEDPAP